MYREKAHRKFRGAIMNTAAPIFRMTQFEATESIGGTIWRSFGYMKCASKIICQLTGNNPRTVENWLYRKNLPSTMDTIKLIAVSDDAYHEVLRLAGRLPPSSFEGSNRAGESHGIKEQGIMGEAP
jgi:hypothetical protein